MGGLNVASFFIDGFGYPAAICAAVGKKPNCLAYTDCISALVGQAASPLGAALLGHLSIDGLLNWVYL